MSDVCLLLDVLAGGVKEEVKFGLKQHYRQHYSFPIFPTPDSLPLFFLSTLIQPLHIPSTQSSSLPYSNLLSPSFTSSSYPIPPPTLLSSKPLTALVPSHPPFHQSFSTLSLPCCHPPPLSLPHPSLPPSLPLYFLSFPEFLPSLPLYPPSLSYLHIHLVSVSYSLGSASTGSGFQLSKSWSSPSLSSLRSTSTGSPLTSSWVGAWIERWDINMSY